MMLFKLAGILLLAITLLLTMSGCWDKQELGDLALILGAAIDSNPDGSMLMTVELAYQKQSGEAGESMLLAVSGDSMETFEAELERKLDKYPYWGNLAALILGQGLSPRQRDELALAFYRDSRIGPGILLLTAEGKAADILSGGFGEASYVSLGLSQAFARQERQRKLKLPTVAAYLEEMLDAGERREGADAYALPGVGVNQSGEVYLEEENV